MITAANFRRVCTNLELQIQDLEDRLAEKQSKLYRFEQEYYQQEREREARLAAERALTYDI